MKLELDKRIDSLSDIFNFSDVENAKQFIGQKGYFTNTIYFFKDLQSCKYGTLINVFNDSVSYNTFRRKEDGAYYEFFIPESFLKPKEKYRPFTLEEFQKIFTIGQAIKFRKKGEKKDEWLSILTGYWNHQIEDEVITYILIGPVQYTLDELFEEYEWHDPDTGEWDLFGVEN